jgi:hypothetical protein
MHQIFISYTESDRRQATDVVQGLEAAGYTTCNFDRDSEIERQIRASDVMPLLPAASIQSEMLGLEVKIAKEAAHQNDGKPYLVPVRINFEGAIWLPCRK